MHVPAQYSLKRAKKFGAQRDIFMPAKIEKLRSLAVAALFWYA
jgi:hypothetical protein